jgi:2-polyprenyl-3-methyl-5-hydroxy-6-metoxy-1,4-benzoquinol methylase
MAQWASQGGLPPGSPHGGELAKMQRRAAQCLRLLARHSPRPGSLLDVGCSAGFFLEQAQAAGWRVEGLEPNPATAQAAAARLGCQVCNEPLEEGAALPAQGLDAVTAWDVIEHLREPRLLLKQAWQALKPGGLLGLSTPNHRGLFPRLSLAAAGLAGVWPHPTPPWHLYQFSERGLKRLLGQEGFKVLSVEHAVLDMEEAFGDRRDRLTNPKYLAYFLALGWSAWLGPWLGRGDLLFVLAAKAERGS